VIYPNCWNPRGAPAHHGLAEMLEASFVSEDAFEELTRLLARHPDDDVLLSAESLTNWLLTSEKQDAFLRLLMAAQSSMATRCVWTLRRLDDMLCSLYLLRLMRGVKTPSVEEHFAGLPTPDRLFEGMRRVREAVGGDVVYVEYDLAGAHNRDLLHAFNLDKVLSEALRRDLHRAPRLNVGLTHKQAATLLNLEALSTKVGFELNGAALRTAIRRGELSFAGDRPCELLDAETKRDLRERALEAACRQGFDTYAEFFASVRVADGEPAPLGPELLTEQDLGELRRGPF
jgi:hypothetical protein